MICRKKRLHGHEFIEFMRAIHRWEEGDLSVILMNVGYDFGNGEYGVDEYYCTVDDNYRKTLHIS